MLLTLYLKTYFGDKRKSINKSWEETNWSIKKIYININERILLFVRQNKFSGDDDYQILLVSLPMLNSLIHLIHIGQ